MKLIIGIICCFALQMCSTGVMADDGPITFHGKYAAGDIATVKTKMTSETKSQTKIGDAPSTEESATGGGEREWEETIISVDNDGKPTNSLRHYIKAQRIEVISNSTKKTKTSLESNFVRIRKSGNDLVVTSSPGQIDPHEAEELKNDLKTSVYDVLPKNAVKIGEEWKISADLLQLPKGSIVRKSTANLVEVLDYSGHKCAHIKLAMDADESTEPDLKVSIDIQGDLYFALDLQRIIEVTFSGPVKMTESSKEGNSNINLIGTGNISFETHYSWKQIAGKSVPVAK